MKTIKKECPRCGKEYETGEVYPLPVCPDCSPAWDAEIERKEKESRRPDDPGSPTERLEKMGIRPMYYAASLENYEIRTPEDKKAVQRCRRMIETKKGIFMMIGGNGTGKTHLACAIVKEMGGRIMKMIEVGMYIRKAFGDHRPYDEDEALRYLTRLPMLAIDEAEKSKGTANETAWFSYIIDERYARALPTVIVANVHLSSIHNGGDKCDKCLERAFMTDVLDRIRQVGYVHYFSGPSYRTEAREE